MPGTEDILKSNIDFIIETNDKLIKEMQKKARLIETNDADTESFINLNKDKKTPPKLSRVDSKEASKVYREMKILNKKIKENNIALKDLTRRLPLMEMSQEEKDDYKDYLEDYQGNLGGQGLFVHINESNLTFNKDLTDMPKEDVSFIIVHHRKGEGDIYSLHSEHKSQTYKTPTSLEYRSGCFFHHYIRFDGEIYRGRPCDKASEITMGHEDKSIQICFEGDYDTLEEMPSEQKEAGKKLIANLIYYYNLEVVRILAHSFLNNASCPGSNFPFEEIIKEGFDLVADNIPFMKLGIKPE